MTAPPPPARRKRLQTIGVALADHIIVADDDFVSMAQSGYLTPWEHL